jgi:hypothetical protein
MSSGSRSEEWLTDLYRVDEYNLPKLAALFLESKVMYDWLSEGTRYIVWRNGHPSSRKTRVSTSGAVDGPVANYRSFSISSQCKSE